MESIRGRDDTARINDVATESAARGLYLSRWKGSNRAGALNERVLEWRAFNQQGAIAYDHHHA
jgi:hypothetical protein